MSVGVGTSDSGEPLSNVDLLPGCGPYHLILSSDYCRDQSARCPAADAGLYDYESSSTINSNVTDSPGLVFTQGAHLAQRMTGNVSIVLDSLSMNTSQSQITIPGSAIDAIHEQRIVLPDGTPYAPVRLVQAGNFPLRQNQNRPPCLTICIPKTSFVYPELPLYV